MKERLAVNAHIRLTEDLIREIRALADLEHRSIQDQMRFMLVRYLQMMRGNVQAQGETNGRAVTQEVAQAILPLPPIAANGRAMTQKRRSA